MRRPVPKVRRGLHTVAAVGLLIGLVAACGSSSKSSAGSAPSSSGSSSNAPTGTPIKIGVIASLSGSQASSSNQSGTVAPAWADWVNANGGINGHPVQILLRDDKGDPVTAQAVGKDLVTAGVQVALAGSDNLLQAWDTEFIAAGIPVIGGTSSSADWYTKVGLYPTRTDVVSGLKGEAQVAKQFGHATKFANLYCAEIAACASSGTVLSAEAKALGMGYVGIAVSSTAPSYTAQCVTLQQQKVDYVQLNFATAAAAKFAQDCQAQGYNPTFGGTSQVAGGALLEVPNLTLFGPAYSFPTVADAPVVKTYVETMTKYAKDDNWHSGAAADDWDGLIAIQKALAGVSRDATVTAKDVSDGLHAFKDENLGGLLSNKINFPAGKVTAYGSHPCYFVIGIKGGKLVAPNGLTPVCPSAS